MRKILDPQQYFKRKNRSIQIVKRGAVVAVAENKDSLNFEDEHEEHQIFYHSTRGRMLRVLFLCEVRSEMNAECGIDNV